MADRHEVEPIVERAVTHVLQGHLTQLREDLVRRVLAELPRDMGSSGVAEASGANTADLLRAVIGIQAGNTQKEILRALLEGVSHYAGRTEIGRANV